jgi:hypothetical protein
MPLRPPAGFISAFFDPLNNPNAPTIGAASAGGTTADVSFTAPANVGGSAISSYSAISTPEGIIGSAASSPVTVSGLTGGTAYTFRVWAINTYGPSAYSAASGSVTPIGTRGLFNPGENSISSSSISYLNLASGGSTSAFGNITLEVNTKANAGASTTRACFYYYTSRIDYVTISTTGNATFFGNNAYSQSDPSSGAVSNSTDMIIAGGYNSGQGPAQSQMSKLTIATTGSSTGIGSLTSARYGIAGLSSPTRGVFSGGQNSTVGNVMDYVTIATAGGATSFGTLLGYSTWLGACSSATRGVIGGGYSNTPINVIQYITIATTGNATDFGDLTAGCYGVAATSSSTLGIFAGGDPVGGGGRVATISQITIASTGNSSSFGSFSTGGTQPGASQFIGATSNGYGGVQ